MKNRIRYTDEPLEMEVVKDFLPPPEALIRNEEEGVKVTLVLGKNTVSFFKRHASASKRNVSYQRMIRRLLDIYAERFEEKSRKAKVTGR